MGSKPGVLRRWSTSPDTATAGTVPAGFLVVGDSSGNAELNVSVTVPLDRTGGHFNKTIPKTPTARMVVSAPGGKLLLDRVLSPGERLPLPVGGSLVLNGVGYYARLQVVDDWSTSILYAGLIVAVVGLTVATLVRQQIVLATVTDGPDGVRLAVKVRLWHNAPSSRDEIEDELSKALGVAEKGRTS